MRLLHSWDTTRHPRRTKRRRRRRRIERFIASVSQGWYRIFTRLRVCAFMLMMRRNQFVSLSLWRGDDVNDDDDADDHHHEQQPHRAVE